MIHRALTKNGKWIYGFIVENKTGAFIISLDSCERHNSLISVEVQKSTIGKKSDWKDMHGNDIYEGDIIRLVNASGIEVSVTCEYGKVVRELKTYDGGSNKCELLGFYFRNNSNNLPLYPIVENYLGKTDFELFNIDGTIHDDKLAQRYFKIEMTMSGGLKPFKSNIWVNTPYNISNIDLKTFAIDKVVQFHNTQDNLFIETGKKAKPTFSLTETDSNWEEVEYGLKEKFKWR